MLYNYYNNGYHLSQWDFFWMAFKPLIPVIVICIAVFVIFLYFWRWYIRKVQRLLRREIRRAASIISCTYYFTNNKKGN